MTVSTSGRSRLRGDETWRSDLTRTGVWDVPQYWTTRAYSERSPFSAAEVSGAFAALREIYSHARTRRAMQRLERRSRHLERPRTRGGHAVDDGFLWRLLADPWSPSHSRLLALGLDVSACAAAKDKNLVKALLAGPVSFEGAAFEICVWAAMVRVGIRVDHEPLVREVARAQAEGRRPNNPDFAINVGLSYPTFLEVKRASAGDRLREESEWLIRLGMGSTRTAGIPTTLAMLDSFGGLQELDGGAWMRANFDRLLSIVEDTKVLLERTSETFPAVAIVEDCIRVEVKGRRDSVATGGALGLVVNSEREARRIVRSLLAEGVTQLPENHIGVILLDPGTAIDTDVVRREVGRWLAVEGAGYTHIAGVLIATREYANDLTVALTRVVPEWRPTAPPALRDSIAWDGLGLGLSWHALKRAGLWDDLVVDAT